MTSKHPLTRLYDRATEAIRTFLREREEGASLTEYALLVGLLALVAVVGMAALSGSMSTMFTNLANALSSSSGGS
jgi:Flp pilus assembly pilin Flp